MIIILFAPVAAPPSNSLFQKRSSSSGNAPPFPVGPVVGGTVAGIAAIILLILLCRCRQNNDEIVRPHHPSILGRNRRSRAPTLSPISEIPTPHLEVGGGERYGGMGTEDAESDDEEERVSRRAREMTTKFGYHNFGKIYPGGGGGGVPTESNTTNSNSNSNSSGSRPGVPLLVTNPHPHPTSNPLASTSGSISKAHERQSMLKRQMEAIQKELEDLERVTSPATTYPPTSTVHIPHPLSSNPHSNRPRSRSDTPNPTNPVITPPQRSLTLAGIPESRGIPPSPSPTSTSTLPRGAVGSVLAGGGPRLPRRLPVPPQSHSDQEDQPPRTRDSQSPAPPYSHSHQPVSVSVSVSVSGTGTGTGQRHLDMDWMRREVERLNVLLESAWAQGASDVPPPGYFE